MDPGGEPCLAGLLLGTGRFFKSSLAAAMIAAMTTLPRHPSAPAGRATEPPAAGRPRPRKLWLLLTLVIYPIITTLETVADPILRHLARAEQFALVVPVMVAVMVWAALPFLHRHFGGWMAR
ncbi:MAG: hypothetical protein ACLP0L_23820 [Solirubrobacteraceae bacterium]